MTLRLHNTLTRRLEEFAPLDPANVRMYVCGPTVYDYAHIGNARAVLVFDVLYRLLRHIYGAEHVTYARNITDVDDKIIAAHQGSGEPIEEITRRTTQAFHEDVAALGALPPTIEPRATAHIAEMIALTETLLAKGHAYLAEGHVLFHVPSMADYGRLSRRNRDELIAGARVEVAPYKKDPADFVLWKPSTPDQPGWDSPWGRGRPGWHLECSAMSEKHLGKTFDIHGGGIDLIFPHHENEIAQSTCAHGQGTFARVWMHNGFLGVEGEKMSKSLGNFVTIREALKEHHGEVLRLAMLMTHYRQPLDWTQRRIREANTRIDRYYGVLQAIERRLGSINAQQNELTPSGEFLDALEDDLNTPRAISVLDNILAMYGRFLDDDVPNFDEFIRIRSQLIGSGNLLGILALRPEAWRHRQIAASQARLISGITEDQAVQVIHEMLERQEIEKKIAQRNEARKAHNFLEADYIRDELAEAGIILEDGPDGTTWRRG